MTQTYQPISGLVALAEGSIKGDDLGVVVDIHDTTQASTGSTKKFTLADLRTALLAGSNGAFADDAVLKLNTQSYTFPASQVVNGFLKTDGSGNLTWVSEHSAISLAQLSDVSLTSPATGQFLAYSGGLWVNRVIVTADVSDLASAATGITQLGTVSTGVWNATAIAWAKVNKTGSSLADLTTRSAADLSSGVLADARVQQSNVTQYQGALAIAYTQLTYSGLTTGQVLRATAATTAAFGALDLANASAVTGALPWANVNKTGSSLADLTTRSAADLSTGTLPDARFPATLPALSGVNLTALNASALGSGNVPYARMPSGNGSWDTGVGTTITITRALTVSGTLTGTLTGNADTATNAAKWTTARNLAGNSVDGSADVAFSNKFIVQGTADAGLSGAQFLGALGTGIVKNTTTTGVLSIAVAGDFPTLNQNTTGSAAKLTTPRAINGVNFDGSAPITVTADAATLTGTTLNATVVTSSLTAIGTLASGAVPASLVTAGTFGAGAYTFPSTLTVTGVLSSTTFARLATGGNGFSAGSDTGFNRIDTAGTSPEIFRFLNAANGLAGAHFGTLVIGTGASGVQAPTDGLYVQGVAAIGTTVVTSAAAGELILGNAKYLRFVNAAGTNTIGVLTVDASNQVVLAHDTQIGGADALATNDTALLLYVDRGNVEAVVRVTVGASDSGGTGKRLLVVPN